jgi:hypothetical protein
LLGDLPRPHLPLALHVPAAPIRQDLRHLTAVRVRHHRVIAADDAY